MVPPGSNESSSLTSSNYKGVYELRQNTVPQCAYLEVGRMGNMNALASFKEHMLFDKL